VELHDKNNNGFAVYLDLVDLSFTGTSSSIGHPPLSSASPVKLLGVGPRRLSEKKGIREQGVKNLVCQSVRNAPKENKLVVNK
jgi:hypothetical protein